jgi:four helix bundle suffix protein
MSDRDFIRLKGDFRNLIAYQKTECIYDITYYFAHTFLDNGDRTRDQMIQAARSGKQNIVEGYTDASTSYEVALKLYNIARGSLMELLEDYHDYLRTRNLRLWELGSKENRAMRELGKRELDSAYYLSLAESRSDETLANMIIVLLHQEDVVLKSFIESEGRRFSAEGGFREKLLRIRLSERDKR